MSTENQKIKRTIFLRVVVLYYVMALLAVGILARIVYLQQIEGEHYRQMADNQQISLKEVEAERGSILSAEGMLLATTIPSYDIHIDMQTQGMNPALFNSKIDAFANDLERIFGEKTGGWKNYLKRGRANGARYYWLQRAATFQQRKALSETEFYKLGSNASGIIVERRDSRINRTQPYGQMASRTLGFVRDQYYVGLEGFFNEHLSGVKGKQLVRKVPGDFIPIGRNQLDPEHGNDLITSISIDFQDITHNALLRGLEKHKATHGCAVLMEVKTGAIKAISNLGIKDEAYLERYNYAVGGAGSLEPGSTMKLPVLMAALDDDRVYLEQKVNLNNGTYKFDNAVMRDAKKPKENIVTLRTAFEMSSNVGISRAILDAYPEKEQQMRFLRKLGKMGLVNPTGIELNGELQPVIGLSDMGKWNAEVDMAWLSVGYNARLSPLQMLAFYNAIANGGTYMKPSLVTSVERYGRTIEKYKPEVLHKQVAKSEIIGAAQELLRGVATRGTAKYLQSKLPFPIAGKTGTAQVSNREYKYSDGVHQASFVGYFPADEPLYSCIVVVYHPKNGSYYGSSVAAPIFSEIASGVYSVCMREEADILYAEKSDGVQIKKGLATRNSALMNEFGFKKQSHNASLVSSFHIGHNPEDQKLQEIDDEVLPDLRGMGLADALFLLNNYGIEAKVEGRGKVVTQSIRPGTKVRTLKSIKLRLS